MAVLNLIVLETQAWLDVSLMILPCAAFLHSRLALQFAQMQDYAGLDLFSLPGTSLWYMCHAHASQQHMPFQVGEINANLASS